MQSNFDPDEKRYTVELTANEVYFISNMVRAIRDLGFMEDPIIKAKSNNVVNAMLAAVKTKMAVDEAEAIVNTTIQTSKED